MRFFVAIVTLLSINLCARADLPKQPEKAGNASEKGQAEINPLPPVPGAGHTLVTAPDGNTNQRDTENKWDHWKAPIDIITTAIIALFTAFTYFNLRSQLDATKIGERAWMVPHIGSIEETKTKGTFQVICQLVNNGRTPAWVTAAGSVGLMRNSETELPKVPPYTKAGPFSKRGSVLPPTAFMLQGFPLTNEQLIAVAKKDKVLYLTGFIEYRDIYDTEHRTKYCYQLKAAQDLMAPAPLDFYIGGPSDYNDAT